MPYIGKNPVGGGFHKLDALTASATATYALTLNSAAYYPESANQLLVSLNGVIQAPQDSFTVSGSNLVFDTALTASDSIDFVVALGDVLAVQTVTDGAITANKIGTDAVTTAKIQDGAVTAAKLADTYQDALSVALLSEEQASGTSAGTFTGGSWVTRTLNTENFDTDGIVSLSGNVFTLGAGTYLIEWSAPAYAVGNHQTRLYDNTNSTVIKYGTSEYNVTSPGIQTRSFGTIEITISSSTGYKIEHQASFTSSTYGLGAGSGFGNVEVFTQVKITKLAQGD